jgi:hypothetical protein
MTPPTVFDLFRRAAFYELVGRRGQVDYWDTDVGLLYLHNSGGPLHPGVDCHPALPALACLVEDKWGKSVGEPAGVFEIVRRLRALHGFSEEAAYRVPLDEVLRLLRGGDPTAQAREDWQPYSVAVARAARKGYLISLSFLSKKQDRLRTRPKQLPGKHRREVEMNSLWAFLVSDDGPVPKPPPNEMEADGGEPGPRQQDIISARITRASEKNRKERPLD